MGWLRKTGEAPVIIDSAKIKRSLGRLEGYHLRKRMVSYRSFI